MKRLHVDTRHRHFLRPLCAVASATFLAGPALAQSTAVGASPPPSDMALVQQVLSARAGDFASLKGQAGPADQKGNPTWNGAARPFGLSCQVISVGTSAGYLCSNAVAQPAQASGGNEAANFAAGMASGGLVGSSDDTPKTGLSDEAANSLYESIKATFHAAAPGLGFSPGASPTPESRETLAGSAPGQYEASIELMTLTEDGNDNDAQVSFTIYAVPLTHDPMQQ
jgi:hypothetical protein